MYEDCLLSRLLQLGEVNTGNNTLFARAQKMDVAADHLTLVISIGGSGAAALKQAVQMAGERLRSAYKTQVKFIMVDSALNEMSDVDREIIQIATSSAGIQERLKKEKRPNFYKAFMPEEYQLETIDDAGAGQTRMTGKVKFYDKDVDPAVNKYNDEKLREAIRNIFQWDWASHLGKRVDIMIVAGLAGGTGSGTFLDVAAHARYACRQASPNSSVTVFGYLFLPDTMDDHVDSGTDMRPMQANGYAALKELESDMSISFSENRVEHFGSMANGVGFPVEKLFDYPVLISGGYDEAISMAAENILNMIGKYNQAQDENGNNVVFDQASFYSNTPVMRAQKIGSLGQNGMVTPGNFPEDSRSYSAMGYARMGFPEEIVTANIVGHVAKNVFTPEEIEGTRVGFCTQNDRSWFSVDVMQECICSLIGLVGANVMLTERSLWENVIATFPNIPTLENRNACNITKPIHIATGDIKSYYDGFDIPQRISEGTKRVKESLAAWLSNFKICAKGVMEQYGPRALQFLYDGVGPSDENGIPTFVWFGLKNMIDYVDMMIRGEAGKRAQYPDTNVEVPNPIKGVFVADRIVADWKAAYQSAAADEVWFGVWRNITARGDAWDQLKRKVEDYLEQAETFAESLELLQDDYFSQGSSLDLPTKSEFLRKSEVWNFVNLCSTDEIYGWVKQTVREKINGINTNQVRQALVESFCAHTESWCSSKRGVTRKEFDRVMSECCQLGIHAGAAELGLSTRSYFDHLVEGLHPIMHMAGITQILNHVIQGIAWRLQVKSAPKLHLRESVGGDSKRFVIIPSDLITGNPYGWVICQAFANYLHGTVVVSSSTKDVMCYQASVANAVSDVQELPRWEQAYRNRTGDRRLPIHLNMGEPHYGGDYVERTKEEIDREAAALAGRAYQPLGLSDRENIIFGTGLSWAHYPEIDLHHLADNISEREFLREIFNPIVDYALEKRLIERVGAVQGTHRYVVHLLPESWENLDMALYGNRDNATGLYVRGSQLFQYLANLNHDPNASYTEDIKLIGGGIFGNPFNFTQAGRTLEQMAKLSDSYMRRILRKNTKLFLDLRKTLNRYYEVERQLESQERQWRYPNKTSLPETESPDKWICPACGCKWDTEFKVCPNDGTPQASEE